MVFRSGRFLSSTSFASSNHQFESLGEGVKDFVRENAELCQPDRVHVCDGSREENERLLEKLQKEGRLTKVTKYDNW